MNPATPDDAPARPGAGRLFAAGALAAVIAAILNAVVFSFGGISPNVTVPGGGGAIDLTAVLLFSAVPPLLAAALLWGLYRFVPGRALTIFWWIAAAVLVLFVIPPFTLGAPATMVWTLQLMHIVVAIPTVWLLTRAARRET